MGEDIFITVLVAGATIVASFFFRAPAMTELKIHHAIHENLPRYGRDCHD